MQFEDIAVRSLSVAERHAERLTVVSRDLREQRHGAERGLSGMAAEESRRAELLEEFCRQVRQRRQEWSVKSGNNKIVPQQSMDSVAVELFWPPLKAHL